MRVRMSAVISARDLAEACVRYLQPIETIAEVGAFMKSFMEKHG